MKTETKFQVFAFPRECSIIQNDNRFEILTYPQRCMESSFFCQILKSIFSENNKFIQKENWMKRVVKGKTSSSALISKVYYIERFKAFDNLLLSYWVDKFKAESFPKYCCSNNNFPEQISNHISRLINNKK